MVTKILPRSLMSLRMGMSATIICAALIIAAAIMLQPLVVRKISDTQPVAGDAIIETAATDTVQNPADNLPPVTTDEHFKGAENPEIVLIEYSDFDCPFCKQYHPTLERVIAEYGDQVAWVYRHFPLDNIHPAARIKAEASECVASLAGNEAFWQFNDALFALDNPGSVDTAAELTNIAGSLGIATDRLSTCIETGAMADAVEADLQGGIAAGVEGTPHSFVMLKDGKVLSQSGALPYEALKQFFDQNLKK